MTVNDNLSEIKTTLEAIRKDEFPNVSPQVIEQIVDIQFNNQEKESRAEGKSQTRSVLKAYIDSIVVKEADEHAVD